MKILNLGLDSSILDKNSRLAERIFEYGSLVEKYIIIVPARNALPARHADASHVGWRSNAGRPSAAEKRVVLSGNALAYGVPGRNKFSKLLGIYRLAQRIIKDEKIDVITVQDQYYLGLIAWLLVRKNNIGLELQVHGFEKFCGLRKIIAKLIIPKADSIRTVSQRLKKRLVEEFWVKEKRITVVPIHIGTSHEPLATSRKDDDKFIFLTIGRLVSVKNISLQIKAMAGVIKKYPNAELWIVGEGPERGKLEVLSFKLEQVPCKQEQVSSNVKFFGWRKDIENFYNQADAFLLTSNAEGWPLVIIEAASFGLPIIMTDVGSAGEFIINGQNGIVIPLNDRVALAQAMERLVENSGLRKKLGDSAREAFLRLPSKEEILKLYRESWAKALNHVT